MPTLFLSNYLFPKGTNYAVTRFVGSFLSNMLFLEILLTSRRSNWIIDVKTKTTTRTEARISLKSKIKKEVAKEIPAMISPAPIPIAEMVGTPVKMRKKRLLSC